MDIVFILGAGASIPFGFPSGNELRELIIASLSPTYTHVNNVYRRKKTGSIFESREPINYKDYDLFLEAGFGIEEIEVFSTELIRSNKYSIDSFLQSRKEFINIGKFAIANIILRSQNSDNIFNSSDTWIKFFWNKINSTLSEFESNSIGFVTFNYDILIEQFFYLSLKSSFNLSDEQIKDTMQRKPIFHLHGSVGSLPWLEPNRYLEYGFVDDLNIHLARVSKSVSNIKIIHEDYSKSIFENAIDLINGAKRKLMIGIGFHPENLERLDIRNIRGQVISSAYGLTENQRIHILNRYNDKLVLASVESESLTFTKDFLDL